MPVFRRRTLGPSRYVAPRSCGRRRDVLISSPCTRDGALAGSGPVARATPGFSPFASRLPTHGPADRDIRVAVFGGGVTADGKLGWGSGFRYADEVP